MGVYGKTAYEAYITEQVVARVPVAGDIAKQGCRSRRVVDAGRGRVAYVTEIGKVRSCGIEAWQKWCRHATHLMPSRDSD